jgi:hypothetical protein
MTKSQRQRVRRAAAVISLPRADIDDEVVDERVVRWRAVRRWRGEPEPLADWQAFRPEQDASH